ncbi:ANTAR domain-containing protein [Streptomyces guryensis]|uniref:ANTAR domain-containing protein n=1 Tax=Streptomyces guryensis TaxID=2886947 RepID=UPI0027DFBA26|nr:ANTAR domain-containing protein [Streptomyces guryensis]
MAFFAVSRSQPLKILSATDLAVENERLEVERAQLEQAVSSHAVVDQAIGAVVVLGRMAPEEAWRVLRDVSQRTNTKLRAVAEHVMAFTQGVELPEPERIELRHAIARYASWSGELRNSGASAQDDRHDLQHPPPPQPPPRRVRDDDLRRDVGPGRADRRHQPGTGLPRHGRPRGGP